MNRRRSRTIISQSASNRVARIDVRFVAHCLNQVRTELRYHLVPVLQRLIGLWIKYLSFVTIFSFRKSSFEILVGGAIDSKYTSSRR